MFEIELLLKQQQSTVVLLQLAIILFRITVFSSASKHLFGHTAKPNTPLVPLTIKSLYNFKNMTEAKATYF